MQYYYPCVPKYLSPVSEYFDTLDRDTAWVAGVKKNGWRADSYKENGSLTLWTRRKTIIHDPLPELRKSLISMIPDNTIVDGELLEKRTKDVKQKYYAFDLIMLEGKLVTSYPLWQRKKLLESFMNETEHIEIERWVQVGKKTLYLGSIDGQENEGIVIKKLDSKYYYGFNDCPTNPFWIKVKKIEEAVKAKRRA